MLPGLLIMMTIPIGAGILALLMALFIGIMTLIEDLYHYHITKWGTNMYKTIADRLAESEVLYTVWDHKSPIMGDDAIHIFLTKEKAEEFAFKFGSNTIVYTRSLVDEPVKSDEIKRLITKLKFTEE